VALDARPGALHQRADLLDVDPLIKMALIHHQFESIHPFYDGNGRTGRIVNVLYLVKEGLLDIPVLYLSSTSCSPRQTTTACCKPCATEDPGKTGCCTCWKRLSTALAAIDTVQAIKFALQDYKHRIRADHKFYSQDLINNLFMHPYTKIDFIAAGPAGVAHDGHQVPGRFDRRRVCAETKDRAW
jgi:Fic family protein